MDSKTVIKLYLFAISCNLVYAGIDTDLEAKWQSYKIEFKKNYQNPSEDLSRKIKFINTLKRIEKVNKEYGEGYLGLNKFADFDPEELKMGIPITENFSRKLSKKFENVKKNLNTTINLSDRFQTRQSESVDWSPWTTVPKNQRVNDCGSCWAFAAASILESAWRLYGKGPLMSMSNQQLLDCTRPGNNGKNYITNDCGGNGRADMALEQLKDRGQTLVREDCYPRYSGRKNQCQQPWGNCEGGSTSDGYFRKNFETGTESEMENWIRQAGPVAARFRLDPAFYNFKGSAIWEGPCNGDEWHIVAVVGFTRDYWIVKNSYGTDWGNEGYFHLRKGRGTCYIGSDYIQLYYQ